MTERIPIALLGGGLAGSLLAILLARRGLEPVVFERGPPHDSAEAPSGRTINLALAARGIEALRAAGVHADIEPLLIPMSGRIVHDEQGETRFLAYGQREHERIYSVSRAELNRRLYRIASEQHAVEYRFGHECIDVETPTLAAVIESSAGRFRVMSDLLLATDGGGSAVRKQLAARGILKAREDLLDHGYKELAIAARQDGRPALATNGLHIWPRGGYMLIALPNVDGTFTATLFLPLEGDPSFATLTGATARAFFESRFPDVLADIHGFEQQFDRNPVGQLGTVHCNPWHIGCATHPNRRLLLLGDAAHAIVPFHGQGLNAAFEDCVELDRLIGRAGTDWARVVAEFEASRRDDARAIAEMALENYREMRDDVRDPEFERNKALSFELERRFGRKFIPRYSMVMFHPEIGYAEAQRRGSIQAEIIGELRRRQGEAAEVDYALAERLVERAL